MAAHAPSAAGLSVPLIPVQLTLQLCASHRPGVSRVSPARQPYWTQIDLADLGGELRARNHAVRISLTAQSASDGSWTGYYDALFSQSGVSGPTRPQATRQDALATAAHAVARHCRRLLGEASCHPPRRCSCRARGDALARAARSPLIRSLVASRGKVSPHLVRQPHDQTNSADGISHGLEFVSLTNVSPY